MVQKWRKLDVLRSQKEIDMINTIKHKKITFIFSGTLFVASLVILAIFGLKPGIDFTGGSLIEVSFSENRPELSQMTLTAEKYNVGSVINQPVDTDGFVIKTKFLTEDEHQQILNVLRSDYQTDTNKVFEERIEVIGPAISSQLRNRSISAGIAVVIAIILYVAYAFRKVSKEVQSWKYGLTAIIALVHDVVITMAVFSLLGHFKGVEIDIPFVVALLTILGYSVNDTIVVFDRIRENVMKKTSKTFEEMVNQGVQDSFTRSINTSLTTLIVLVALFLFGGDSIHYFSLALIIGIIAGTYSSIFLASPLLVVWKNLKK